MILHETVANLYMLINIIFLFVFMLLCIYFSPYFFKSDKFLLKNEILKIFFFVILLYMIKSLQTYTITLEFLIYILDTIDFKILGLLCFFAVSIYIGYIKLNVKKETYLFLRFEIFYLWMPFIFFLEGYCCIWFFILHPFYKIADFFFTCLFKYLENLYYNFLPKFNILLAFFVWGMLSYLEKTNKYQVLFENFSLTGFLLIFLCHLFVYFYFKKSEKMLFLIRAYLSCVNFFIAICVLIVILKEIFMSENRYKIVLEYFSVEILETNFGIFFFFIFFFMGIFCIYNKKLFLKDKKKEVSLKTKFYNFGDFFLKNLGYFFFNGFAIGRVMVGGIVKTTAEGIVDTDIVHAVESAKFEPPKSKQLIIPKTQEEFVVFVADNATEIRKNPVIRNECIRWFKYYRTHDEAFRLVTQETYDELESGGKFLMINGKRTILLGNLLPLWYPNIPHGPDAFLSSQDTIHQLKTGEKVTARNVVDMQKEYSEGMLKGSLLLNYFYVYIPEEERNKLLRRQNKCPELFRSMLFTDITTIPPSKPEDFVLMKKIAIENEVRMQQKRNEMLKEAIINPNRIRQISKIVKK